jgi:hypothetical protein
MKDALRQRLPRLLELSDLCEFSDTAAYFSKFQETVMGPCGDLALQKYDEYERSLQSLDLRAWEALKEKVAPRLTARHAKRGWTQLFDTLGEADAYNHLKSTLGCTSVTFIPESSKKHHKTPDLEGVYAEGQILCEAKTINISDSEIDAIGESHVRNGDFHRELTPEFLGKLTKVIGEAKSQIEAFDDGTGARHLVYVTIYFDDWLGRFHEQHSRDIDTYLAANPPGVEVYWVRGR